MSESAPTTPAPPARWPAEPAPAVAAPPPPESALAAAARQAAATQNPRDLASYLRLRRKPV